MALSKELTKEERIAIAVDELNYGRLSYRGAQAKYGIPRSTLSDHALGKVTLGKKPGPSPVLTPEEEKYLAQWTIDMYEIGYGQTRQQVTEMVKKILDKDGRPNPFKDNRPGKDWWYSFLTRNKLAWRSPSALEAYRASACTKEKLEEWYTKFEQFLICHGLHEQPSRIWNCDESGFPLCAKSGKILAPVGSKTVYSSCAAQKTQITTLVAISAGGQIIPPMHIFPGQRFAYNPLEGGVEGAYFASSSNGWIKTELFYGWIKKHFSIRAGRERPLLLLVDGHTTHIDLDVSQFCKDDQILLYCLPPHSSHITQPLDVGFFSPLKTNWKRAVHSYKMAHIGQQITKQVFARVFKEAWLDTIKPRLIVNAFSGAGIYPVDASKTGIKVVPSKVFCKASEEVTTSKHSAALDALEAQLSEETKKKFAERLAEGYDLDDPLYIAWRGLKMAVTIAECDASPSTDAASNPIPELNSLSISSAFKDVLTAPKPVERRKTRVAAKMPSHISSDEVIRILEDKRKKKEEEEAAKTRRKAEREERKRQREKEKEMKASRGRGRGQRGSNRGRGRGRGAGRRGIGRERKTSTEDSTAANTSSSDSESDVVCPTCKRPESVDEENTEWVQCDNSSCSKWYHVSCTGIDPVDYNNLRSATWLCPDCEM